MIYIRRITIKNFRQYRDINLSFDDKAGLYLFIGKNGMGKSNFLNAVCWCLYDNQPFNLLEEDKLLNEETEKIDPNAEVKVTIEVVMDDQTYLFQRSIQRTQNSKFSVMIKKNEDWVSVNDPNIIVNKFLPESVREFFLFDGESIEKLYLDNYWDKLREGIWRVSNVKLLDRASEHLDKTHTDIRRTVSKDEPTTEVLEKELEELEGERKELNDSISARKAEISDLSDEKYRLSGELKKYSSYKNILEERDIIKSELDQIEFRLSEYRNQISEELIDYAPFWNINITLLEVTKKINESSQKGELPPKIKSAFVKELLERGTCICGNHIASDSNEYQQLKKLLTEVDVLDARSYLLEDKLHLNNLTRDLATNFGRRLRALREKRANERARKDILETKLRDISERLVNSSISEVGNLESTVKRIDNQISETNQEIGRDLERLEQLNGMFTNKQEELNKLNREKEGRELDQMKVDFIEEAKDSIDYIREKLVDQVRRNVQLFTNQYFRELMWKKDEFIKINFTEDYKVEIFKGDKDGRNYFDILSKGERKVLSLATMKALAKLSGFEEMPIFFDAPLENLGDEIRHNFLDVLPEFVSNKQVFIFSLDNELTEEFGRKNVDQNNYFQLIRINDSISTNITRYS